MKILTGTLMVYGVLLTATLTWLQTARPKGVNPPHRVVAIGDVPKPLYETLAFNEPELEDLQAFDPEGWQAVQDRPFEEMKAWANGARHRLFELRYGHAYVPGN